MESINKLPVLGGSLRGIGTVASSRRLCAETRTADAVFKFVFHRFIENGGGKPPQLKLPVPLTDHAESKVAADAIAIVAASAPISRPV
jgi:hypothetical protein